MRPETGWEALVELMLRASERGSWALWRRIEKLDLEEEALKTQEVRRKP